MPASLGAAQIAQAGTNFVVGAAETYSGWKNAKNYQKQLDGLQRPVYTQSPYENQMLTQAESQAGKGISDASRTAYMNDAQSGLAGTISAIEKGGGDVNSLGSAYGKYQGGLGQIAMYDDQARQRNLSNVMSEYARQSANDDKSFMFNTWAPYADKKQALVQQLQGAKNMEMSGINTMTGAATKGTGAAMQPTATNPNTTGQGMYGSLAQPDYSAMYANFGSGGGSYYSGGGDYNPIVSPQYPIGGATSVPGGNANTWGWNG